MDMDFHVHHYAHSTALSPFNEHCLCHLSAPDQYFIAFPSTAILIANAAPSKSVLGSINGVAASVACLSRALGPIVTGFLHTVGLKMGYTGLAWWIGGLICAIGAVESFWMEDPDQKDGPCEQEESPICEPLLHAMRVESSGDDLPRRSIDSAYALDLSKVVKG